LTEDSEEDAWMSDGNVTGLMLLFCCSFMRHVVICSRLLSVICGFWRSEIFAENARIQGVEWQQAVEEGCCSSLTDRAYH